MSVCHPRRVTIQIFSLFVRVYRAEAPGAGKLEENVYIQTDVSLEADSDEIMAARMTSWRAM